MPLSALDKLDKLIKKNETAEKKTKLKQQFEKNIKAFDAYGTTFHHEYINYEPTEIVLKENNGSYNLINLKNNQPVYPSDPETFTATQVEDYLKKPLRNGAHYCRAKETMFKQPIFHNKIIDYIVKNTCQEQALNKANLPVGLMIINGIGLGYHLPLLMEKFKIFNLVIIEHHKDIFFANLHVMDWQPILDYYKQAGKSIQLNIDVPSRHIYSTVATLFHLIGDHHRHHCLVYNHLASSKNFMTSFDLLCNIDKLNTPAGFIEDEIISVAHTVENVKQGFPIAIHNQIIESMPMPAFVVGNGPSLDAMIPVLKAYQSQAFIISCGTTLATLENYGIVPDLHVELERTSMTTKALLSGNSKTYLKKIPCLALNNVPPQALSLFQSAAYFLKPGDTGASLLDNLSTKSLQQLTYPNPTVSNAGLSIALTLGFETIFLAGVDLGMSEDNRHHANKSEYYNNNNTTFQQFSVEKDTISAPGNFRATVNTTSTLKLSAQQMELLLTLHPNVNVYNLSDGLYIEGTKPLPSNHIKHTLPRQFAYIDKKEIIAKIKSTQFELPSTCKLTLNKQTAYVNVYGPALAFIEAVRFSPMPKDIVSVYQELNQIMTNLRALKKKFPAAFLLLHGSVSHFLALIYQSVLATTNHEEMVKFYGYACQVFLDFLNAMKEEIKHHGLEVYIAPH